MQTKTELRVHLTLVKMSVLKMTTTMDWRNGSVDQALDMQSAHASVIPVRQGQHRGACGSVRHTVVGREKECKTTNTGKNVGKKSLYIASGDIN